MFAQRGVESMEVYRRARAAGQFADDPFGDVFLVIDGWQTVRQEFEKLEPQIQELASRGLTYGVHMVVGTNRWSEIRPWLRDVLQTRFELRLGENMESEIDFRKAKDVPEIPGRGLTADKYHYLAAVPRLDGEGTDENLSDAVGHLVSTVRRHWTGHGAPKVRRLPARFGVRELPAPPAGGELRVAYALDEEALEPVWHDFDQTPHLLAFGDSGTGKTNLLRVLIQGITRHFTPDEARILLVDPKRRLQEAVPRAQLFGYAINPQAFAELLAQAMPVLQERVPGADIPPDRLSKRDWWTGSRMFVFIDDYEMMGSPMNNPAAPLIDLVAQGAEIGLHVVIARNTGQAMRSMMSDQLVRRMWDLSTPGLLFSCPRDEGNFLGDAKPLALPTGRAQAVLRRRGITQIQVALDESAEGGEEA